MTLTTLHNFYCTIFPFWYHINDNDRELLCRSTIQKNYNHGSNIHGGDGKCTGAIIVKSGCIRAYILSDEGREVTLYRLYPGDICMLSASCVLKSITFNVMVDAEADSECLILNGKVLSEISDRNLHVKNFALEIAVNRFSNVMWIMQQILFMSFDRRLAIFLMDELSKNKSDTIKMSNSQIAKYMGSAREVVSRMMKYFNSEGILERNRSEIHILDKDKLKNLAL